MTVSIQRYRFYSLALNPATLELLEIFFRYKGDDYKGTATPVKETGEEVRYIITIPRLKEELTVTPVKTNNTWIVWKDYDTNEESMLIEIIGKAIGRAL